jgi:sulfur-oxidizing protein SoxY
MVDNINKSSTIFVRQRRGLLLAIGVFLSTPLAWATRLFAARPSEAFRAETIDDTLRSLYGEADILTSDKIRIAAADLAENGAVVPLKVEAKLSDVRAISIIAVENPIPLVGKFVFGKATAGFVATRVKLAKSGDVIAVVETANGLYQARKTIEVTIGGCGV